MWQQPTRILPVMRRSAGPGTAPQVPAIPLLMTTQTRLGQTSSRMAPRQRATSPSGSPPLPSLLAPPASQSRLSTMTRRQRPKPTRSRAASRLVAATITLRSMARLRMFGRCGQMTGLTTLRRLLPGLSMMLMASGSMLSRPLAGSAQMPTPRYNSLPSLSRSPIQLQRSPLPESLTALARRLGRLVLGVAWRERQRQYRYWLGLVRFLQGSVGELLGRWQLPIHWQGLSRAYQQHREHLRLLVVGLQSET